MKIAITYEAGFIYQHFGHTAAFKVYDIENGVVVSVRAANIPAAATAAASTAADIERNL